jgi:hypothetical protein
MLVLVIDTPHNYLNTSSFEEAGGFWQIVPEVAGSKVN